MKERKLLKWVLYLHSHRKIACLKPFFRTVPKETHGGTNLKILLVSLGTRPKKEIHITSSFQVKI